MTAIFLLMFSCTVLDTPADAPLPPDRYHLSEVWISLQRMPCADACPAYVVTLYGNGSGTYVGRENVAMEGRHRFSLDERYFVDLLKDVYASDFFSWEEEEVLGLLVDPEGFVHTVRVSEARGGAPAGVTLTVHMGGYQKTIYLEGGEPENLWRLAQRVDAYADTGRWVWTREAGEADTAIPRLR